MIINLLDEAKHRHSYISNQLVFGLLEVTLREVKKTPNHLVFGLSEVAVGNAEKCLVNLDYFMNMRRHGWSAIVSIHVMQ